MQFVKQIAIGLLCGAATGAVVLGFGGRLMMRAISLLTDHPTEFSSGGSLEVVVFGAIIGSAAGAVYSLIDHFLPGNTWLKGSLLGLHCFIVVSVAQIPSVERSASAFANFTALIVILFGAVFLLFGLSMAAAMRVASRMLENHDRLKRAFQSKL